MPAPMWYKPVADEIGEPVHVLIQAGTLTASAKAVRWVAPYACRVKYVRTVVATAPTVSGSVTVDVNKNGTTIFTTQANRPSIPFGSTVSTSTTGTPDAAAASLAAGDVLSFDVDTIGGTVAGADLYVVMIVVPYIPV
jgi:hypothetical protein